jgi:ABC-type glycerol-3-phosphate transport system permease component
MRSFFIIKNLSIIILLFALIISIFPIFWMILSSIKTEDEIYKDPPTWIPEKITLKHYEDLFKRFDFYELTINSIIISVATTILSLVMGTMAGYGFSRYGFPGSKILLTLILIARMITPAALVVPLYTLMKILNLLDTVISIIIGTTVLNLPFVIWIMKAFFDNLPKDAENAAAVDGSSPFQTFWRIVIPMSASAIVTVALFSFIAGWVDFLFGITFSTTNKSMPLTVGIAQMQTGYEIYWGPMMAGGVYLTLPTFIIAFLLQKYFIKGFALGY